MMRAHTVLTDLEKGRPMPRVIVALLGFFLFAFVPAVATAQATSMANGYYFGNWKLNNAKSKRLSGPYSGESSMIIKDVGGGFYFSTVIQPGEKGQTSITRYLGKFDDVEYPMSQLNAAVPATVSNALKEPFVTTFIVRNGGKISSYGIRHMSKDGNTLIVEMSDPQRKPTTTLWWERAK
jgi:signal peptidase I